MKKLIALSILCAMCLTSCGILREEGADRLTLPTETGKAIQTEAKTTSAETDAPFSETEAESEVTETLPTHIGLYDELQNDGVYTRLDSWRAPWTAGVDIAVFDVILSAEASLTGASYKKLWQSAADAVPLYPAAVPYLVLEYTLIDGTVKKSEIRTPADAESVIADGYLEVYLYDDIHRPDGAWYSHLTEADMTDGAVISSVKLTAGDSVEQVAAITLSAHLDGSNSASVDVIKE